MSPLAAWIAGAPARDTVRVLGELLRDEGLAVVRLAEVGDRALCQRIAQEAEKQLKARNP